MLTIIELTYKKPITEVDKYLVVHREFLDSCYEKNLLLASGPKAPRDGGILFTRVGKEEALKIMENDPFYQEGIADYRFIEFDPVKKSQAFGACL